MTLRRTPIRLYPECLNFVGLLLKNHLHIIFLAKSAKSLLRSALFIKVGVGEKPNPFPKTLISKSVNIYD